MGRTTRWEKKEEAEAEGGQVNTEGGMDFLSSVNPDATPSCPYYFSVIDPVL